MRRARGMTMIEVMVALLIATVGLVGALSMSGSMLAATSSSRQASEATAVAQWKMEELMLMPGTSPLWGVTGTDGCDPQLTCVAPAPLNVLYTRTWTWADAPDGNKTVNVSVQWSSPDGRAHGMALTNERNPLP